MSPLSLFSCTLGYFLLNAYHRVPINENMLLWVWKDAQKDSARSKRSKLGKAKMEWVMWKGQPKGSHGPQVSSYLSVTVALSLVRSSLGKCGVNPKWVMDCQWLWFEESPGALLQSKTISLSLPPFPFSSLRVRPPWWSDSSPNLFSFPLHFP